MCFEVENQSSLHKNVSTIPYQLQVKPTASHQVFLDLWKCSLMIPTSNNNQPSIGWKRWWIKSLLIGMEMMRGKEERECCRIHSIDVGSLSLSKKQAQCCSLRLTNCSLGFSLVGLVDWNGFFMFKMSWSRDKNNSWNFVHEQVAGMTWLQLELKKDLPFFCHVSISWPSMNLAGATFFAQQL